MARVWVRVSLSPTMTSSRLARVMVTFKRRTSLSKPMPCWGEERTKQ